MKTIFNKYKSFIIVLTFLIILTFFNKKLGIKAITVTAYSFKEMLMVIPPIFILLGLLDVWVPKETMVKYMGENSGLKGIILAMFIGSAAAGPLYGAFPVAAVFMKKGVSFKNILIFIGAWSTTKIPMLLFEATSLGLKFTLTRLFVDIIGIVLIAFLLSKIISTSEIEKIYKNAENIEST